VGLSIHDERGDIPILIKVSLALVEALGPCERDFPCNATQSCGHSLGVTPFLPDIKNLHALWRSCGTLRELPIGRKAITLH
jgi:hypothetical protein